MIRPEIEPCARDDNFDLSDRLSHLWLPAGTLALFQLPALAEFFRKSGRASGSPARVGGRLIGAVTTFVRILPAIVGAAFITELIYAWPGEGRLFILAAGQEDLPLLTGLLLFAAMSVLMLRFIAELVLLPDDSFGVVNDAV